MRSRKTQSYWNASRGGTQPLHRQWLAQVPTARPRFRFMVPLPGQPPADVAPLANQDAMGPLSFGGPVGLGDHAQSQKLRQNLGVQDMEPLAALVG